MPDLHLQAPAIAATASPAGTRALGGPAQLSVSWSWEDRQTVVVQLFSLTTLPACLIHSCRLSMKTARTCRFRMPAQFVGPLERNVEFRLEYDPGECVRLRADIPVDANQWFRDVLPAWGEPQRPIGLDDPERPDRAPPAPEAESRPPLEPIAGRNDPGIHRRLLGQVLELLFAIPAPRPGAVRHASPKRVGTNHFIHRIDNQSSKFVQVTVLDESARFSYDAVLGPGESRDYAAQDGATSAPVPAADSDAAFPDSHIRLRVGDELFALFVRQNKVRQVIGDEFDESAPALDGFAGPGPMALVIRPGATLAGQAMTFATGPQLAAVAWTDSCHALYGIDRREGTLVQKAHLGSHWDNWRGLGKPAAGLRGPIAAASRRDSRYAVYTLGQDGQVYEKAWLTDRWEEWTRHAAPDGVTMRNLAAIPCENNRYAIYAVSDSGGLYRRGLAPDKAHDWEYLDGPDPAALSGPIIAIGWNDLSHGICALGADHQVWQSWHGIGTPTWESLGSAGSPLRTLTSAAWNKAHYLIAGVAADGNLWCREHRLGWAAWKNLGRPATGALAGAVTAVSLRPAVYAFYAEGADGLIHELYKGSWRVLDGS